MVTRRIKLLVLVYVALGLVSCIEADPQYEEAVPYEGNGDILYAIDPTFQEEPYQEQPEAVYQEAVPLDTVTVPNEEAPVEESPTSPQEEAPVEPAPTEVAATSPQEEAPVEPAPTEEESPDLAGGDATVEEAAPGEPEPTVEEEAPLDAAPTVEEDQNYGEETTRIRKRRRKTTTTAAPQSCEDLLEAIRYDCFSSIPPGYDADSCAFNIRNENCDWDFMCEEIITEAPTTPDPDYEEPDSSSSEYVDDGNDSDGDDVESCETDRKIRFKNCFINIKGLIQKHKALSCEKH